MTDFLLELFCEEIPARMQAKARADLERLFAAAIGEAGLKAASYTTYSTPRRLALIAHDLPLETEAVREERKGPKADAPEKALEGFLRSTGLTRDQLEERETKKGNVLFAVIDKPGRKASDVLAEAIPSIVRAFPWPKSMRWGAPSQTTESLKWVRPLHSIVALLGDDLVELDVDGVKSGYATQGHRFHSEGAITIGNAADYAMKLRAAHVLVDHEERQNIIRDGAAKAAADAGLVLVADEGLVIENAGLTEWPVPMLGSYDVAFLDVPEEVIQLTTRINQKYFVVRDKAGKLAPNFVCTANIEAHDGGKAIVAGNEKVLAARLSDAKFFWELDQKTRLEDQAKKLSNIVFHEKLGTVADKVERVAKLAEWLVSLEGTGLLHTNPEQTKQAARLCKADLVTEMVGEFPELQGLMGGYYAEKEGLPLEVSNAIRDHYKPVGQGDDVPTDPMTVAVSLADKLDTLVGFFAIDEKPTGSKDPFALRRAALSIVRLVTQLKLSLNIEQILDLSFLSLKAQTIEKTLLSIEESFGKSFELNFEEAEFHTDKGFVEIEGSKFEIPNDVMSYAVTADAMTGVEFKDLGLLDFFADRLKVQQREAGVRHDLIDAIFALGGEDDLVRLLARVKALQSFVETEDGTNLLAGYKRASNILKKSDVIPAPAGIHLAASDDGLGSEIDSRLRGNDAGGFVYAPEPAEAALLAALDAAEPKAAAAIEAEDFEGAMAALASLRAPIDAFFENVTVNDDDADKRSARLGLLVRVRDAVHTVADFSKIEG